MGFENGVFSIYLFIYFLSLAGFIGQGVSFIIQTYQANICAFLIILRLLYFSLWAQQAVMNN